MLALYHDVTIDILIVETFKVARAIVNHSSLINDLSLLKGILAGRFSIYRCCNILARGAIASMIMVIINVT